MWLRPLCNYLPVEVGTLTLVDARTLIFDFEYDRVDRSIEPHVYSDALGGEGDDVVEEVLQHLMEPFR